MRRPDPVVARASGSGRVARASLFAFCLSLIGLSADAQDLATVERVSLLVGDLDRALSFYSDALGYQAGDVRTHPSGSVAHDLIGLGPDATLREIVLRSDDTDSGLAIVEVSGNVVTPSTEDTSVSIEVRSGGTNSVLGLLQIDELAARKLGGGVVRIEVPALDSAISAAESLGLEVLTEHSGETATGSPMRQRVVVDWDGNRVALFEVGESDLEGRECVVVEDLVRWKVFDDRHIYIESLAPGPRLLLTTQARCRGALYSNRFEIPNAAGRVCKTGSRIAYRDAGLRRTCRISSFEVVEDIDEAAALARE